MQNSKATKRVNTVISVVLSLLCLAYIYPIVLILLNSFKQERSITTTRVFELPTADTFVGFANYIQCITSMDFLSSFWYSLFISVSSVLLILLCCSMCAWYITRVHGKLSSGMYYLCVSAWWCPSRWSCSPWPKPPTPSS